MEIKMSSLQAKLQHRYALSEKGAQDMMKAFVSVTISDLVLMFPVWMLYFLVRDYLQGTMAGRGVFYLIGCLLCLALIAITTLIQYRATFLATYVESGVRRIALAEQLRKIPLSFFGKKDLSDLTSAIMSDCATMETASSHYVPELVGSCISTTLIAIGTFFMNWKMAIAALWVLPVSFLIVGSRKVQKSLSKKQMKLKMDCADGIQECLETVRDLRANNAQAEYMEGLEGKIRAVEKHALTTELGTAVFVGGAQMILKLGIATVALTGGILLVRGEIDVLTFFVFLLLVSRMYDPLQVALQNLAAIISTGVQSERLDEILSAKIQTGADTMDPAGYDIEFSHVGFSYDNQDTVLKDVTFTAKQGEVTALIGPSGGGKTTVSRLASRFWDIHKGKITVGGMDISTIDPETLMSLYAIVFQDVTLFNNTVMENIRIGRQDATDEEVLAAAKLAHCDEFAEKLPNGWQTMIGENGSELSGGERQRISIARAFLKDAPIILLDEATASLDVDNETMIQESLSKLIRNKTVMIIAHRMRTVADSDKIVVLKDGVVAEQGTPAELEAKDSIYRHMKATQMEAAGWTL
jgi:ATP-binding cassette subfamily B protein IrtB